MSKPVKAFVLAAIAVLLSATLVSSAAEARRFGPLGFVRSTFGRVLGVAGLRHARMAARHDRVRTAALKPGEPRTDIESAQVRRGGIGAATSTATGRTALIAAAALAGWHGGRSAQAGGWWRHADGAYGWIGPLFWPYAFEDISDYVTSADGAGLYAYGYGDIYAAIFAPYAASDLVAYTGDVSASRRQRRVPNAQEICGAPAGEGSGLPRERIEDAVQPNETQRAALDELATAWREAADVVRSSCPAQAPGNALQRLTAMQSRLAAMLKAVATLQPPLAKFHDVLDDEQKARLNALASAASESGDAKAGVCASEPPRGLQWQTDDIATTLRLSDTQRAALDVLQDTSLRTLNILAAECRPPDALTMSARLAAADRRLEAMLQSVSIVRDALDDFYANLSDQQKAQFEAIGPKRGV